MHQRSAARHGPATRLPHRQPRRRHVRDGDVHRHADSPLLDRLHGRRAAAGRSRTIRSTRAHGHLHRRGRFGRFFMYLSLFCFSMLNLVLADNLFQVFVSWELVGICSYLLVGFYFERQSASNAANKAFITNRVGDAGFIIGLLILWTYVGTFNFEEIFRADSLAADATRTAASHWRAVRSRRSDRCRAQRSTCDVTEVERPGDGATVVLFPRELAPDITRHRPVGRRVDERGERRRAQPARRRPVRRRCRTGCWSSPASASSSAASASRRSSRCTSGCPTRWKARRRSAPSSMRPRWSRPASTSSAAVYPLFTPEVLLVIAYTGGITLFVAATIAVVMTDIKKVLAYSTVSQLGYMMLALGVGGWAAGLFHLLTHAFFKALLFLGSGSVIYGCHHEQDMTQDGRPLPQDEDHRPDHAGRRAGHRRHAALQRLVQQGRDPRPGASASSASIPSTCCCSCLPLVTAGITTFYMFRMWFLTFTGKPRDQHVYEHAHESPWMMTMPLIVLAVFSVCVAWGWPAVRTPRRAGWRRTSASQPSISRHRRLRPRRERAALGRRPAQGRGRQRTLSARTTITTWPAIWPSASVALGLVFAGVALLLPRSRLRPRRRSSSPRCTRFLMEQVVLRRVVQRRCSCGRRWSSPTGSPVRPDGDRRHHPLRRVRRRCGCRSGTACSTTTSSTAW